ncbi:NADH:flavin oxidoreductase/NADH oxidase [Colletotrichum tofieldiae]|uniref:NADH:flavin oxidoreductase/NADH oxidase n=1 Tax=Colletotrichum tofieldiae TaxID=708197 RepID=A0A166U7T0_9PEZI|nr:NADH:flavin oxidoreductase/NADH oxidase [Colletotrichum tofieldiae]
MLIAGGFNPNNVQLAVEEHGSAEVAIKGIPLTRYERNTFHAETEEGYTDCTFKDEFVESSKASPVEVVISAIYV